MIQELKQEMVFITEVNSDDVDYLLALMLKDGIIGNTKKQDIKNKSHSELEEKTEKVNIRVQGLSEWFDGLGD